jgi:hypothetical protein
MLKLFFNKGGSVPIPNASSTSCGPVDSLMPYSSSSDKTSSKFRQVWQISVHLLLIATGASSAGSETNSSNGTGDRETWNRSGSLREILEKRRRRTAGLVSVKGMLSTGQRYVLFEASQACDTNDNAKPTFTYIGKATIDLLPKRLGGPLSTYVGHQSGLDEGGHIDRTQVRELMLKLLLFAVW